MQLSKSSMEAVQMLLRSYQELLSGDYESSRKTANDLAEFESKVDHNVGQLKNQIIESRIFSSTKYEVLEIVQLLEESVDKTMEAARIMTLRKLEAPEIEMLEGTEGEPGFDRIFHLLVRISDETHSTLELAQKNLIDAGRRADRVEEVEEEIDKIKLRLLGELYVSEDKLKIMSLLQLKELILALDSIADAFEDVSDEVERVASLAAP